MQFMYLLYYSSIDLFHFFSGKRAAWDTKGRLADLEELQKSMKQKIRDNDDRVVLLEELLKEKETAVSSLSRLLLLL